MKRNSTRSIRAKRNDSTPVMRSAMVAFVAVGLVQTGAVQTPFARHELRYQPVVVEAEPAHKPIVVRGERPRPKPQRFRHPDFPHFSWLESMDRAPEGKAIRVSLTQYCLRGITRRGTWVRPGIVAADPQVFPLARHVEVFLGSQYLGRYRVEDTGKNVVGNTLDIWTPNCREARRFGRQWGHAVLVAREESVELAAREQSVELVAREAHEEPATGNQ